MPPGSDAARKADKERDALRKREERGQTARLAPAPALPSALAPAPGANGTASGLQAGNLAAEGLAGAPAPIQWQPDMVKEFSDELINAAESSRVTKFISAAREAKLPEALVRQISTDCHYPVGSKKCLQAATPRVACKWLNKAGISAEFADELALLTAIGSIFIQGRKLEATLEQIKEQNQNLLDKQKETAAKNAAAAAGSITP